MRNIAEARTRECSGCRGGLTPPATTGLTGHQSPRKESPASSTKPRITRALSLDLGNVSVPRVIGRGTKVGDISQSIPAVDETMPCD